MLKSFPLLQEYEEQSIDRSDPFDLNTDSQSENSVISSLPYLWFSYEFCYTEYRLHSIGYYDAFLGIIFCFCFLIWLVAAILLETSLLGRYLD